MKILDKIIGKKSVKRKSFFDYSATEKKKIVKKAAIESNKEQLELVRLYSKKYNFK